MTSSVEAGNTDIITINCESESLKVLKSGKTTHIPSKINIISACTLAIV